MRGISSVEGSARSAGQGALARIRIVKGIQPICFENACHRRTPSARPSPIKSGVEVAARAAKMMVSACSPSASTAPVAEDRKVGPNHGAPRCDAAVRRVEVLCLPRRSRSPSPPLRCDQHLVRNANKAGAPCASSLNGLGKDAAQIISHQRLHYVQTQFDYFTRPRS